MYEAGLIDRAVQREPRYELIIDSFLAGIVLMEEQEEIEAWLLVRPDFISCINSGIFC